MQPTATRSEQLTAEAALDVIYLNALTVLQKNEIGFSDVEIAIEVAAEGKTLRRSFQDALRMKLEIKELTNV